MGHLQSGTARAKLCSATIREVRTLREKKSTSNMNERIYASVLKSYLDAELRSKLSSQRREISRKAQNEPTGFIETPSQLTSKTRTTPNTVAGLFARSTTIAKGTCPGILELPWMIFHTRGGLRWHIAGKLHLIAVHSCSTGLKIVAAQRWKREWLQDEC